jgi:hypothetical protein
LCECAIETCAIVLNGAFPTQTAAGEPKGKGHTLSFDANIGEWKDGALLGTFQRAAEFAGGGADVQPGV